MAHSNQPDNGNEQSTITVQDFFNDKWAVKRFSGVSPPLGSRISIGPCEPPEKNRAWVRFGDQATPHVAKLENGSLLYADPDAKPGEKPTWHVQISLYRCTISDKRYLYAGYFMDDPEEAGIWGADDDDPY